MPFTEDTFEQAVVALFEGMGYEHIYAPDLERDYSRPLMDSVLWAQASYFSFGCWWFN